jgi:hypothetical protein
MPTSNRFTEGMWVQVKDTGRKGVVVTANEGLVEVRIPSGTDWPFPSYVECHFEKLKRVPQPKKEVTYEPAPF